MGDLIKTSLSEVVATMEVLDRLGVMREHLRRIRSDKKYAERVAESMFDIPKSVLWIRSQTHDIARLIMGENFFGVEEAIKYFGVNPTRQQLVALLKIPFSEATLKQCKETHVLVAVFPMSILEIRDKMISKLFFDQCWYNKESFAKERGEVSWQLVRKTPVGNSTSKTWQEQQALLDKKEEKVPSARVMIYTIIGHYLATSERLFEYITVHCSDVNSHGHSVHVGRFDSYGGMYLDYYNRKFSSSRIGVASAWNSNRCTSSEQTKPLP